MPEKSELVNYEIEAKKELFILVELTRVMAIIKVALMQTHGKKIVRKDISTLIDVCQRWSSYNLWNAHKPIVFLKASLLR